MTYNADHTLIFFFCICTLFNGYIRIAKELNCHNYFIEAYICSVVNKYTIIGRWTINEFKKPLSLGMFKFEMCKQTQTSMCIQSTYKIVIYNHLYSTCVVRYNDNRYVLNW